MKLKRKLIVFLVCLSCLFSLSASVPYANAQKIFPVDSPVYESLVMLYVSTGRAQPSSSGPWSTDELFRMLQTVPYDTLSGGQKKLYETVANALHAFPRFVSGDSFGFSPALAVAPELYFHTNAAFNTEPDWNYGFTERKAPLAFRFEVWSAEHFYGFVELSLGLTRYHHNDYPISFAASTVAGTAAPSRAQELLYTDRFRSNIPMLGGASLGELSMNMPYRAFLSAGGSHWSFQVGRDRLSWGVGESGNLILSDHYPMHQFLRLSTYHKSFKYTFVASFFPHPVNYRPDDGQSLEEFIAKKLSDPNYQMKGLSMFMGHRFEFRMFQDRLSFALSETVMYQTLDGYFDIQVLSPLMLFHNMYVRGNANSLLGFELDVTPVNGLNIYGMFLLDDLAIGSEPTIGPDSNPNAMGGMLGIKLVFPYGKGTFFGSLEAVYTDPYLYKRDGDVEYIVAFRESNNTAGQISGSGSKYHKYYLGYEYGGDVIVGNLRFGYAVPDKFTSALLAQARFKGLVGIDTPWSRYLYNKPQSSPTTSIEVNGSSYEGPLEGPVEITLRMEPSVSFEMGRGLSFRGSFSFLTQWHRNHSQDAGPLFDFQLMVGATYQI